MSTRRGRHTYYAVRRVVCSLSSVNLSRASPHPETPYSVTLSLRNQPHTFGNLVRSCKTRKLKRKKQTNPPSIRGRTRKRRASLFLDPVSTRRTGAETRGAERNGHASLSVSFPVCSWCLVFGAEERDGIGGRTLSVLQPPQG